MTADLILVHLYPDLLRTYGDRGNILTLQRRADDRVLASYLYVNHFPSGRCGSALRAPDPAP